MSSTASVSSIYGNECRWLHFSVETVAYKCIKCMYFYRYTPPGRRHPSCHGRGPVLTARLSFPSGSGKVWIVASAQESENPPLPPSSPASKRDARDERAGCQSERHSRTTSASHICPDGTASRKTMLITHHMLTLTQVSNQLHHHTHTQLVLI